jgi:hypothetical protein
MFAPEISGEVEAELPSKWFAGYISGNMRRARRRSFEANELQRDTRKLANPQLAIVKPRNRFLQSPE